MDEQVGVYGLFEGSLERCDQLVGQISHESDGVAEQDLDASCGGPFSCARVESREESVLDEHAGVGKGV